MASKRRADTQLTREDLLRDDSPERTVEPENTGPQIASQDTLAKRTILKARRSLPADQPNKSAISSPFASLLSKPLVAPSATGASSLVKISFPSTASSGTTASLTATMPLPNGKAQTPDQKDSIASLNASFLNHFKQHFEKDPLVDLSKNCKEYIEFMKELTSNVQTNQSTVTSTQVEPSVKLPPAIISSSTSSTPAFGGYNFNKLPNATASTTPLAATSTTSSFSMTPTTHASSLTSSSTAASNALAAAISSDKSTTPAKTPASSLTTGPFSSTPATSAPSFNFLGNSAKPVTTVVSTATTTTTTQSSFFSSVPTFTFGSKLDSNFKFGSSTSTTPSTFGTLGNSPFSSGIGSIGSSTPFSSTGQTLSSSTTVPTFGSASTTSTTTFGSFANPSQTLAKEEGEESGDDEKTDEPPKLTDAKMDEEGALYSKVIKLFFLRDKKFESMGKGMVHIKKLSSGKNQLLVRGENALGSIWLNVVLDKTITMKRQGKKDLQVVCFTKLPEDSDTTIKCVTYLLRTASESDVDDLELHLNKFQE